MLRYTKIGLIAVTLAATGIGAYAAKNMENESAALAQAKVSIVQAIATAEQHANGKATRAELEQSKAGLTFDVEVLSGTKVFDVKVDADKGTVISSAEDKADREGDEDNQD
ncbi:PepSY domain-containing protein [Rhodoferax sp.]|uniref:PepSY domain-containing protein n=1 Tax=Rhodoferax sp. TaxID=50421 RepID=UPI002620DA07|nr:PepSY domain-containing protein [Rhodoferax sp.]MDD2811228.1 PepSY domain-containing protein [Rhodoferax sp.]